MSRASYTIRSALPLLPRWKNLVNHLGDKGGIVDRIGCWFSPWGGTTTGHVNSLSLRRGANELVLLEATPEASNDPRTTL